MLAFCYLNDIKIYLSKFSLYLADDKNLCQVHLDFGKRRLIDPLSFIYGEVLIE